MRRLTTHKKGDAAKAYAKYKICIDNSPTNPANRAQISDVKNTIRSYQAKTPTENQQKTPLGQESCYQKYRRLKDRELI